MGNSRRAGRGLRRRLVTVVAAATALVVAAPVSAYAAYSATPDKTAKVDGTVYAVLQVGDRTIIGGDFTSVSGVPRNKVAAIRADGTLDPTFNPDVNGSVRALAAADETSNTSDIYIGGVFSSVDGTPRANLAAVDSSGEVKQGWNADTTGDSPDVLALASSGSRLYVGGKFKGIAGTARKSLVALDESSATVIDSFKPGTSATVKFLSVRGAGTKIFVGGRFPTIGGQDRPAGIAELYTSTGAATPFNPAPTGSLVVSMGSSPSGDTLYYGVMDNRVFAYDAATSALKWSIKNGGDTQAIDATADEVFLGGHFSQNIETKAKRRWMMSVDARDGVVTPWDPQLDGGNMGVWAVQVTADRLLVGGEFTTSHGKSCKRFARFRLA